MNSILLSCDETLPDSPPPRNLFPISGAHYVANNVQAALPNMSDIGKVRR